MSYIDNPSTAGGGGTITGGACVNLDGVCVFDGQTGTTLNFRGIKSESAALTAVLDAVNKTVDLTLVPGLIDHGSLGGLLDDDHTQYALLAGRAGGQALQGGTAATDDLTLTGPDTIRLDDPTVLWPSMPAPSAGVDALSWSPTWTSSTADLDINGIALSPTLTVGHGMRFSGLSIGGTFNQAAVPGVGFRRGIYLHPVYRMGALATHVVPDTPSVFDEPQYATTAAVAHSQPVDVYSYWSTPTVSLAAGSSLTTALMETVRSGGVIVVGAGATYNLDARIGLDIYDLDVTGVSGTFNCALQQGMSCAHLSGSAADTIYSEMNAATADHYFLRSIGTANSVVVGGLRLGDTTQPVQKLEVLGHVLLDNAGAASELRLREPSASGSSYTAFKAQAQAADITYTLPATSAVGYLRNTGPGTLSWDATGAGIDHGGLGGLADDDHVQYLLLEGRSGGQTAIGGTAASDNLTLQSTSNSTRGRIRVVDGLDVATQTGLTHTANFTGIEVMEAAFSIGAAGAINSILLNSAITIAGAPGANGTFVLDNLAPTVTNTASVARTTTGFYGLFATPTFQADGAAFTFNGNANGDPGYSSLVSAPVFSRINSGTGTAAWVNALESYGTVNTGWTVTDWTTVSIFDVGGGGTVTNQIGVDIGNLTKGGTLNVGVRSAITANAARFFLQDTGGAKSEFAGKFTKYNNITTDGAGMTSIVKVINNTGVAAARVATALFTPPATGFYRVAFHIALTTAGSVSSTLGSGVNVNYSTGDSGTAVVQNVPMWIQGSTTATVDTGSTANTIGTTLIGSVVIYCNTTGVTYDIGYTSNAAGTMQYAEHIRVEAL